MHNQQPQQVVKAAILASSLYATSAQAAMLQVVQMAPYRHQGVKGHSLFSVHVGQCQQTLPQEKSKAANKESEGNLYPVHSKQQLVFTFKQI